MFVFVYVREHPVLVGCGSDGAAINISGQNGMRGKLTGALPWFYLAWCFNHRLELACKDSFSSDLFRDVDDMLLRVCYLYVKSPKKCCELSALVDDRKQVFEFPDDGGNASSYNPTTTSIQAVKMPSLYYNP